MSRPSPYPAGTGRVWGLLLALSLLAAGCAGAASPAPASPTPTQAAPTEPPAPASPTRPSPTPTETPPPATPAPAASATPRLEALRLSYSGALSVEDLNTLLLDLGALPGVAEAQGGVNELTITYDPQRVTPEAILEAVKSHGYQVEVRP